MFRIVIRSWSLALAVSLFSACASQNAGKTAAPAEPASAAAAAPATPGKAVLEPPDGKWLTDEDGQQYFIVEVPRYEGEYTWIDEKTVRLRHGMPLKLASYDDTTFYAKIFRVEQGAGSSVRRRTPPTAEELQRVAASYAIDVPAGGALRLEPFETGLPQAGQWRNGIALADMNGDGKLDIVTAPPRKGTRAPVVFLGDGAGGWKQWPLKVPRMALDYGDVEVADFNGDGHPDIALAMHVLGTVVLVGDGQGGFTSWSTGLDYAGGSPGLGLGYSSRALVTVDWNGDRRPDILTMGEGMGIAATAEAGQQARAASSYGAVLYVNRGDGTWERRDQGTGAQEVFGDDIEVGDFDADGRVDFASSAQIVGRKDLVNLQQPDGGWRTVAIPQLRDRAIASSVAVADFDGDRRSDLAVGYRSFEHGVDRGGVDVFLSRPAGETLAWERRALLVRDGRISWPGLATGDLDGDGKVDLIALSNFSEVESFRGDGRGGFSRLAVEPAKATLDCRSYDPELADLDGDGRAELVANFAGESGSAQNTIIRSLQVEPARHCPGEGALRVWRLALGNAPRR